MAARASRRPTLLTLLAVLALAAGACQSLVPGVDAANEAQWAVDPRWEPSPDATEIPLFVVEVECASGRDATGRVRLDVDERDDEVVVTAMVVPRDGDQDCQGNPPTPVTLVLDGPLGGRSLVNGASDEIARRPVEGLEEFVGTTTGDGEGADGPGDPGPVGPAGTVVPGDGIGERELFLVEAFHARGLDASELGDVQDLSPHPDGVQLWIGPDRDRTATIEELGDPQGWVIDREEYAGWAGPFSALETVGRAARVTATPGARPHCASPARPSPGVLAELARIAVEPVLGPDSSCLEWFVVNLYLDADDRLVAVQLDLWAP